MAHVPAICTICNLSVRNQRCGTKVSFKLQHHIVNYVIGLKSDFTIARKFDSVTTKCIKILSGLHKIL